jgi:hypothetical protein
MALRNQPQEPRASAEYLFGRMVQNHDEWAQFLHGW